MSDALSFVLLVAGVSFFVAGTVGMLRFPDVYTRLHALTKVDNLGLGLIVLGLVGHSPSWTIAVKLLLIWVLAMLASATSGYLVARTALRAGIPPWRKP